MREDTLWDFIYLLGLHKMLKNLHAVQETWVQSLNQEDPLEKGMTTTAVFLPGESCGQRRLAGVTEG